MRRRNDGTGAVNALQNRFTAYLLVAVRRQKYAYMNKQNRVNGHEVLVDYQSEQFADGSIGTRIPMQQMEDSALMQALEQLTARERYILFGRVLGERSYEELSGPLGLRYNGIAAAYRRVIQKLRKELGGGKP